MCHSGSVFLHWRNYTDWRHVSYLEAPSTIVTHLKHHYSVNCVCSPCSLWIYRYVPRNSKISSEVFHCKRGINQTFLQAAHIFNPALYPNDLSYSLERDVYPIVIHCVVDEGIEETKQSHTTICVVDHHSDGTYGLRALKQKIFVDGLCYLLQEIYGIENKSSNKASTVGTQCEWCANTNDNNNNNQCHLICIWCETDQHWRWQWRQFGRVRYLYERYKGHANTSLPAFMFMQFVCGLIAISSKQLSDMSSTIPSIITDSCRPEEFQWGAFSKYHITAASSSRVECREYSARLCSGFINWSIEWARTDHGIVESGIGCGHNKS